MDGDAAAAWHAERVQLLHQLADETARVAALSQQLRHARDDDHGRPAPSPPPREPGTRLLAREAERHALEVARLQEAERVALARAEGLQRQLREARAELRELRTEHATELMQRELEVARHQAVAAGLQAAARRRAGFARLSAEELQARHAQHEADERLLAGSLSLAEPEEEPVIVPPEWMAQQPAPDLPLVPTRNTLPELPEKRRRGGFWKR